MKKMRGYNFSRPFMGERVPQHVQNIVIKDFFQKNGFNFLLSVKCFSKRAIPSGIDAIEIFIPFILSFITAFLTLKLMVKYIYVFGFTPYVIYRIFLGIILLIIAYS